MIQVKLEPGFQVELKTYEETFGKPENTKSNSFKFMGEKVTIKDVIGDMFWIFEDEYHSYRRSWIKKILGPSPGMQRLLEEKNKEEEMGKRNRKSYTSRVPTTLKNKVCTSAVRNKSNSTVVKTSSTRNFWETELEVVQGCGKLPDDIIVIIKPLAMKKIEVLMNEYSNIEWLAYLIKGEEDNVVEDLFIPSQEVTAGSVDNIDSRLPEDMATCGVIHSHHNMGNNFSHTDDEYINGNHAISLCVSHNGIQGQIRVPTACGALAVVKATIKIDRGVEFDEESFLEDAKRNIKKRVYTYQGKYGNLGRYGGARGFSQSPFDDEYYGYGYGGYSQVNGKKDSKIHDEFESTFYTSNDESEGWEIEDSNRDENENIAAETLKLLMEEEEGVLIFEDDLKDDQKVM